MRRNWNCKKCCCLNNNMNTYENDAIEDKCDNYAVSPMYDYEDCECGYDEEDSMFPVNPVLAQSYVPWQTMDKTFVPCVGLKMGTIYPELVSPYFPGQSQKEIEYIEATNKIREGCNKC